MTTELQLFANRQNALLSTGPKDTNQTRFNRLRFGLRAESRLILGEDAQEYETFSAGIRADLAPDGTLQSTIVERIVFFLWRLKRAQRAEAAIINNHQLLVNTGEEEIDWDKVLNGNLLEQVFKYEANAIKHIGKLLSALENLKKGRDGLP